MLRTHTCGGLRAEHADKKVSLCGWVDTHRIQGKLSFILLRDRYGITQVVSEPTYNKESHEISKKLRSEYVISIEGTVRKRPEGTENSLLATGNVDVMVDNRFDDGDFDVQDAMLAAMNSEKASFKLYTDLANSTDDPGLKETFLALANEEAKHKLQFEIDYDDHVFQEN